jgi:hypothetical protein
LIGLLTNTVLGSEKAAKHKEQSECEENGPYRGPMRS